MEGKVVVLHLEISPKTELTLMAFHQSTFMLFFVVIFPTTGSKYSGTEGARPGLVGVGVECIVVALPLQVRMKSQFTRSAFLEATSMLILVMISSLSRFEFSGAD